ncbi:MAG: hypothetical protein AB1705_23860, partial [Verrucomicrobiota bacterium]
MISLALSPSFPALAAGREQQAEDIKRPVRNDRRSGHLSDSPTALIHQEQLLPFLLNPRSYPHAPREVRLIQTHSSFVFMAPPFVFKIKKPVDFGFLNLCRAGQRTVGVIAITPKARREPKR